MSIPFSEFPLSYRLSQRGVALCLVCSMFAGKVFAPNAPPLWQNPFAMLLAILSVPFFISFYVIVRYPYISLIEPDDGDEFSKNYGLNTSKYNSHRFTVRDFATLDGFVPRHRHPYFLPPATGTIAGNQII